MRLDHLQRETGGSRGIKSVAALFQDAHADRRGQPMRRGDGAKSASDLRSSGKGRHRFLRVVASLRLEHVARQRNVRPSQSVTWRAYLSAVLPPTAYADRLSTDEGTRNCPRRFPSPNPPSRHRGPAGKSSSAPKALIPAWAHRSRVDRLRAGCLSRGRTSTAESNYLTSCAGGSLATVCRCGVPHIMWAYCTRKFAASACAGCATARSSSNTAFCMALTTPTNIV